MFSIFNFQEQMAVDLDTVFFNTAAKEFVTSHMIGGIRGKPPVSCDVVADHELYKERKIKDSIENITLDGLVIFIKKEDWIEKFKGMPKAESALLFDDRKFQVEAVDDDMGILEITLCAARG